ncbi:rab11 family-interacting protein 4A-like isoform X2 [Gordionus sp. m RMFG-2023]|uniref:rab11 family-interacting protein 4A-like isoform X2 n=1 Tax=Gordionus sp. m RMFG-2023 TaxID=3053472 RepID=UPI0031FCD5FB
MDIDTNNLFDKVQLNNDILSSPPPIPPRHQNNSALISPLTAPLTGHSNKYAEILKNATSLQISIDQYTPELSDNNIHFRDFTGQGNLIPNFQRTRSLCYKKKRRKLITASDDTSFDYYCKNHNNENENYALNHLENGVNSYIHEENVADITEKIITNINDHLERFEKNQNGELERDNKHLNRDNAILKEKIRMQEELIRENEFKADLKLNEVIAQNRKFLSQVEKEKTEEIQRLKFRVHHLEKQTQEQEIVNERLQNMVESFKKEMNETIKEFTVCKETNQDLRDKCHQTQEKYNRLKTRLEKQDFTKNLYMQDSTQSLLHLKRELTNILGFESSFDEISGNSKNSECAKNIYNGFLANDKDEEENKSPELIMLQLKEIVSKIKNEKEKVKTQKQEIMLNIMDKNNNNHHDINDILSFKNGNFDPTFLENTNGQSNEMHYANLESELKNSLKNNISMDMETNDIMERKITESLTIKLEKENRRLKAYIDNLLLIILETHPSMLEIKIC